jgi:hypothetical protein
MGGTPHSQPGSARSTAILARQPPAQGEGEREIQNNLSPDRHR